MAGASGLSQALCQCSKGPSKLLGSSGKPETHPHHREVGFCVPFPLPSSLGATLEAQSQGSSLLACAEHWSMTSALCEPCLALGAR